MLAVLLCAMAFQVAPAAQQTTALTGTWDVHIEHFTGRVVNEQWIIRQDGGKVAGKVVVSGREYPLDGTVERNKINFKVTVRAPGSEENAEGSYNVFLGTVDGNSIRGEIKKLNDDGTFSAKRAR